MSMQHLARALRNQRIIAVDFDGTCVKHKFPYVGEDIGAVPTLKLLVERGHLLVLHTVRAGQHLDDAVGWFQRNGIPLYGVNFNPSSPSNSPKPYADIYIDDRAAGCPLTSDLHDVSCPPFCDWSALHGLLARQGYFD